MKAGFIGLGAMGARMAGHVLAQGEDEGRDEGEVLVYDIDAKAVDAMAAKGAKAVSGLTEMMVTAEVIIVMVANDGQVLEVVGELAAVREPATVIAIAATVHPETMALAAALGEHSLRLIDAPVVHGLAGAVAGTLLSLCGGDQADIETARPIIDAYSREVVHIGGLGHGQLAKAVNNMLHWAHCVSNFEALLLAKRFGVDAQKLREILLRCPATNGTLEHWDDTKLTWHEKDMDIVMDLAQSGGLTLPLFGQVDQLVKLISPGDIADLLYGETASYLGTEVAAKE